MSDNLREQFERLPLELIVHVFSSALPPPDEVPECIDTMERAAMLRFLRLVSRHWNKIIEQATSFWSVIHNADPPHWIKLSIERSRNAHLDVFFTPDQGLRPREPQFLSVLRDTMHRWRSFYCVDHDYNPRLLQVLANGAPNLTRLDMETNDMVGFMDMGISEGALPRLSYARLAGRRFDWSSVAQMTGLEELAIVFCYFPLPVHLDALLEALSKLSARLKRLSLTTQDHVYVPLEGSDPVGGTKLVDMPSLEELELNGLSGDQTFVILRALQTSNLRKAQVTFDVFGAHETEKPFELLIAYLRPLSRNVPCEVTVISHHPNEPLEVRSQGPGLDLSFKIRSGMWEEIYARLRETQVVFPTGTSTTLHLRIGLDKDDTTGEGAFRTTQEDLVRWLKPQVTALVLIKAPALEEEYGSDPLVPGLLFYNEVSKLLEKDGPSFDMLRTIYVPYMREVRTWFHMMSNSLPHGVTLHCDHDGMYADVDSDIECGSDSNSESQSDMEMEDLLGLGDEIMIQREPIVTSVL